MPGWKNGKTPTSTYTYNVQTRGPLKAPVRAGRMTGKKSKYAMTVQMKYPCLLMATSGRLECVAE